MEDEINSDHEDLEPQISEELVGKVYKKGRGLLHIPLLIIYQRYIYILQVIHIALNTRKCLSPDQEYEGVVFLNQHGIFVPTSTRQLLDYMLSIG